MTAYDPDLIDRLVREAIEDDERATPAPWEVGEDQGESAATLRARPCIRGHEPEGPVDIIIPFGRAYSDATAIARTRNNLAAVADQLEAARSEIDSLRTACDVAQRAAERRGAERDMLREVFYASERWSICTAKGLGSHAECDLQAAIDAYRAAKGKP